MRQGITQLFATALFQASGTAHKALRTAHFAFRTRHQGTWHMQKYQFSREVRTTVQAIYAPRHKAGKHDVPAGRRGLRIEQRLRRGTETPPYRKPLLARSRLLVLLPPAGYRDPALQVADSGRDGGVRDVAYPVNRYVSIYQVPTHFALRTKHSAPGTRHYLH